MAGKIKFNIFKNRDFQGIPAVFFILCLLIGIVFISIVHFQMETESQKRNIRKNAEMLAGLIEGKVFVRLNTVVESLSTDSHFISLLKNDKSMAGDEIQSVLNVLAASVKIDLLYLMDEKGTVFASAISEGVSLEGENYSFRPYFKEASEGKNYIYSALGVTT
nr:hypothetical protein [Candidatus Goldiibacteriota bacterium]